MNINLHIERLVLEGLSIEPNQRSMLQEALQAELVRLLSVEGAGLGLQSDKTVRSAQPQSMDYLAGSNADQVGGQIANAVYRGINR
jgi:hypothetical protein